MRTTSLRLLRAGMLALAALVISAGARADLFGDDEARRAIIDLRQRFDAAVTAQNRLVEENAGLRRNMLDLQQQIQALKDDLARSRGQQEQIERDVDLQRSQQENLQALDERVKKLEAGSGLASAPPQGADADAAIDDESKAYEDALAVFRAGNYAAAQTGFAAFIKRYPRSSQAPSALFWLGNAQYATRNYREAITNFRSLLTAAPNHTKAAESLLSIANCQIELKDTRAARATLETLIKNYPQSEAAQAGRERLARLR
ncbi:MAG: tol-pal system protein YbgF [Burkholderiaceae bacterium]|nr:tol-pal system protein YbgF [Burkholderiaceae bacterium]